MPFPSLSTRYKLLADALQVCTRMWPGELGELGIDSVVGRIDGDDPRTTLEQVARHVVLAVADFRRQRPRDERTTPRRR